MGGTILMNSTVCGLTTDNDRIVSVHWTETPPDDPALPDFSGHAREKMLEADEVLSSMPLKDLVEGLRGAEIPQDVCEIAAGLPYRDFITVGLLVDRLAIRNLTGVPTISNLVPDCWIYIQEPGVKIGRLQIFNNWSPYLVADPENTVWLGLEYFCQENDDLWAMDEQSICAMAAGELEKIGIIEKGAVRDACRVKVKKAYPAYFGTYDQISRLTGYLDRFENLTCIGRNGQHRYNNMDHSMLTAMLAAQQILGGKRDKSAIWQVNAEKEYHEQKS
jgi:protoporphyrinogen oxidase